MAKKNNKVGQKNKAQAQGRAPGGPKKGPAKKGVQKSANPAARAKQLAGKKKLKQQMKAKTGMNGGGATPGKPAMPAGRRTLLLQQPTSATNSRTWGDYKTPNDALDAFIRGYEAQLRRLNPGQQQLTYTVADLQQYVDSLHEVTMLVTNPQTKELALKGKPFIKGQILARLRSAAA
jgi:hypothetical protein